MSDNNTIHVVVSVYDVSGNYTRHAGVLAASIFDNTTRRVKFHMIHDETLTDKNHGRMLQTANDFGQEVNFADVSPFMQNLSFDVDKTVGKYSRDTLFRLFIPDLFPELAKVIYLDTDIVINMDIGEMWDIEVAESSLAGTLDEISSSKKDAGLLNKFSPQRLRKKRGIYPRTIY